MTYTITFTVESEDERHLRHLARSIQEQNGFKAHEVLGPFRMQRLVPPHKK
jgi:hypothetical protein